MQIMLAAKHAIRLLMSEELHLTRIRLQLAIYFCLHRGQFALKHCKTASPHSIKRLECVRENCARRQREPTERPQTNYLAMKRKSMNTRMRSGIIFLSVCVLVGLVAFFAGAHAQVATQSPGTTATPARTPTPFPTFAPGTTPHP
jgi:hypothetical protein